MVDESSRLDTQWVKNELQVNDLIAMVFEEGM